MKKIITLFLFVGLLAIPAFSQDKMETADKSQVEQVMLKKGSLILKEFIPYSDVDTITGEILKITDVTTGEAVFGLRLTHFYYNSQYDSGESTGLLDAKELDSVISTLNYIKTKLPTYNADTPYTEIVYKSNSGLTIGAYHSEGKQKIFLKFDYKDTVYIDGAGLQNFTDFFTNAKNKMLEMGVQF